MKRHKPEYLVRFYDGSRLLASEIVAKRGLTVGRHADRDVVVEHRGISRHHATFFLQEEGDGLALLLRDEGSTNGCRVNGEEVRGASVQILPKDTILIGPLRVEVSAVLGGDESDAEAGPGLDDMDKTMEVDIAPLEFLVSGPGQEALAREWLGELYRFVSVAVGCDVDELISEAANSIAQCTRFDTLAILMANENELETAATWNASGPCAPHKVNFSKRVIRHCMEKGVALLSGGRAGGLEAGEGTGVLETLVSVECAPLVKDGRSYGVIYVSSESPTVVYGDRDLELLVLFANNLASNLASRLASAELAAEKEKLEAILGSLKEGVVVTDGDMAIVSANEAARKILGSEDLVGKSFRRTMESFRPCLHPETSGNVALYKVRPKGGGPSPGRSDEKVFSVTMGHNHSPAQGGWQFVFCLHDVSKVHRLEYMKSILVNRLAHKLISPLTVVTAAISLAANEESGARDEELQEVLRRGQKHSEKCVSLVERLTNYTRLISGEGLLPSEWSEFFIEEIVDDAVVENQTLLDERGFHVERAFPRGEIRLRGDRDMLRLAVGNIVENAVKFGYPAGTLVISAERVGGECRIAFEDNGPGVPPSDIEYLGVLLYQVDPDNTGEVPGAGIGLAVVYAIAQSHGGRVKITSPTDAGAGTLVELFIPAQDSSEVTPATSITPRTADVIPFS